MHRASVSWSRGGPETLTAINHLTWTALFSVCLCPDPPDSMPCCCLGLEAKRPDLATSGPLFFRLIKWPRSGLCACDQAHWSAGPGQEGAFAACCPLLGVLVPGQGSLLPPQVLGCVLVLTCRGSSPDLAQLDPAILQVSWTFLPPGSLLLPPAPQPGRPATCRFPAGLLSP